LNMPSSDAMDAMDAMEMVGCDLCGASESEAVPVRSLHDALYGFPGTFRLVRCRRCGLLYLAPRPTPAAIGAYYPDLDYHAFQSQSGPRAALRRRLLANQARALLRGLGDAPAVIEIGPGTGDLLAELRSQGAQVEGIEPNEAAAKMARGRDLRVQTGTLESIPLSPNTCDLAVMRYAQEHVHSPRRALIALRDALKPGGRVVIWVPNAASWDAAMFGDHWRGYDAPRHLYLFTPATLHAYAEAVGMRLANVTCSAVPNDWAGSAANWLRARGMPDRWAKRLGAESLAALAAWFPLSALAAFFRRSGRIRATLIRP